MKRRIITITSGSLPLLLTLLTLLFCSGGGGTISGTGPHKMGGVLYEQDNKKPAANATVYLRPIDYLPASAHLAKKRTAATSSTVQSTVTDKNGWFGFDDLTAGTYTIEGISSDGQSVVFINKIDITPRFIESHTWLDINSLDYATVLKPAATIVGTVPVPENCNGGRVSVFGTDYHTKMHSDGTFSLEKVPESNLQLNIEYVANSVKYTDVVPAVTVSNQTTVINTSNTEFNPQGPIIFKKMYSNFDFDKGVSIKQTDSEEYIIAGKNGSALHLLKIDKYGQIMADSTIDAYCQDSCHFIEQIQDGGFIIAGRSPDEDTEYYNLALTLIDINGTIIWSNVNDKAYIDEVNVIQQTDDGGFIIGGKRSIPVSSAGFCMFKANGSGDVIWDEVLNGLVGVPGEIIQQTDDGGYIVTGINLYNKEFFIVNTDSNGKLLWEESYGASDKNEAHSIVQTFDHGYAFTGSKTNPNNNFSNIHLIKTDAAGKQLLAQTYTSTNNQVGHELKQTVDGGYIIIGTSTSGGVDSDIILVKTDNTGALEWSKTIGEPNLIEDGHSVWLTSDGGYLFAGAVKSPGDSESSLILIKTDALGTIDNSP